MQVIINTNISQDELCDKVDLERKCEGNSY